MRTRLALVALGLVVFTAGAGMYENGRLNAMPFVPSAAALIPSATVPDGSQAADVKPRSFCGIANFGWSHEGVLARGEQPNLSSLACLRDAGFGAVVNLRSEGVGFDEEKAVEGLGMRYLNVKVADDTAPNPEQISAVLAFIQTQSDAGKPVYMHCGGGRGRVGTLEAIYLLWQGWPTRSVFDRYIAFGAKVDVENGANGQVQAIHEIGRLLDRGDAWPIAANPFDPSARDWPRPDYMAGWDYSQVVFPRGDRNGDC